MEMQNIEEYLSTGQAAKLLGLTIATVQKMTENGVLSAYVTPGGHRRILYSSFNHFLTDVIDGLDGRCICETNSFMIVLVARLNVIAFSLSLFVAINVITLGRAPCFFLPQDIFSFLLF